LEQEQQVTEKESQASQSTSDFSQECSEQESSQEVVTYKDYSVNQVELIELPLRRTVSTHKYCCLCSSVKNLILIPFKARSQAYAKTQIFIPNG